MSLKKVVRALKGGAGSGFFGHGGRMGRIGGSAPMGSSLMGQGSSGGAGFSGAAVQHGATPTSTPAAKATTSHVHHTLELEGWSDSKEVPTANGGVSVIAEHGKYQVRAVIAPTGPLEGVVLSDREASKTGAPATIQTGRTIPTANAASMDSAFEKLRKDAAAGKTENPAHVASLSAASRYAEPLVGRGRYHKPDRKVTKA